MNTLAQLIHTHFRNYKQRISIEEIKAIEKELTQTDNFWACLYRLEKKFNVSKQKLITVKDKEFRDAKKILNRPTKEKLKTMVVCQLNDNFELIGVFASTRTASTAISTTPSICSTILNVCKGKGYSCKGFNWCFLKDLSELNTFVT